MVKATAFTMDSFMDNWNGVFPKYPLTAEDLNKPHMVIGALFQVFDRLGIDQDAILAPPPEEDRNESTKYYWDLLPVINMTRVINHLFSVMPQVDATISVTHFLQPTSTTSHSILLLMFNFMVFHEELLGEIAPYEEEEFMKSDQVKTFEEKKHKLLEMLNEQAEEKGKRAERLELLDSDMKQYEEELKQEKEVFEEEKQQLDAFLKENHQTKMLLEQKTSHRDALIAEVERKRALRVYNADDIKAQAEQAAQNVQEADEQLNTLRTTLTQKENSLRHLHTIKPGLDTAQNHLNEIMKLSESLKDFESGDLESESKEGELEMLNTELSDLRAAFAELHAARNDRAHAHARTHAARQLDTAVAESALREAEEKDRKFRERCEKAIQRTEEIKELTLQYEKDKEEEMNVLANIKETFCSELQSIEDTLVKKAMEVEKNVMEKLRRRL